MKIIVSQQGKKLIIEFHHGNGIDKYLLDKAENFLMVIDKFIRKRKLNIKFFKNAKLEFKNTGLLTERVIRAIIGGLGF